MRKSISRRATLAGPDRGAVRLIPNDAAVIALDLGGTKLASALFDESGQPQFKRATPLEHRQGSAVGKLIVSEALRLQRAAARKKLKVRGIGIAVPGIVDERAGTVWAPNIPGWERYPLRAELTDAIKSRTTKIAIVDDRAASILGEVWQGAAQGCRDAIFLAVGTGIGAGILADGRVLRGAHGSAGAIGWLALDRPFQHEYAECGCFESHASGHGIAKVAAAVLARRKSYCGPLRSKREITAHHVFAAFEKADPIAKEVLTEVIEFWAMAAANLVSLFNPEKIIFGGGVFGPATQFIETIATEARRWAQPIAVDQVEFTPSKLGPDAALYGAARCALTQSIKRKT